MGRTGCRFEKHGTVAIQLKSGDSLRVLYEKSLEVLESFISSHTLQMKDQLSTNLTE